MAKRVFDTALKHPPEEYRFLRKYVSEEREACICGRKIKHVYVIVHESSGHELRLGSECIKGPLGLRHILAEEKYQGGGLLKKLLSQYDCLVDDYLTIKRRADEISDLLKVDELDERVLRRESDSPIEVEHKMNVLTKWMLKWGGKINSTYRAEVDCNLKEERTDRPLGEAVNPLHTFNGDERLWHLARSYLPQKKIDACTSTPSVSLPDKKKKVTREDIIADFLRNN